MKRICLIAIIIMTVVTGLSQSKVFAQENKSKSIPLQAVSSDNRLSIENVSFYKRLEKSATSLNINFEVHNKTNKDLKLKVFLVAFRKTNSVDNAYRKWIPYPKWRERDLDKETFSNILLDSLPKVDKNAVDSAVQDEYVFPDFQKYLQYLNNNPENGRDLLVKSLNSASASSVDGNFPDINIISEPIRTTVFAKLRVPFNPDNLFFNEFAIIITDPEQKKVVASELFHFETTLKAM